MDLSSRFADFAQSLKRHVRDGLSPELALDLALNQLVVAATAATHASAAALALARGEKMVCRATTGDHAPDLGMPLNTHAGLSGACLLSREAQHCFDTESDERVDSAASRRLRIRSILVVPILDGDDPVGIIEVFSREPAAFSESDELQLQNFAHDCLKLRRLSAELAQRPLRKPAQEDSQSSIEVPAEIHASATEDAASESHPEARSPVVAEPLGSVAVGSSPPSSLPRRSRTDILMLVLSALVIASAVALTFLIGFRTGWLRAHSGPSAREQTPQSLASQPSRPAEESTPPAAQQSPAPAAAHAVRPSPLAANGGLVIYERGKVVFRAKPISSGKSQSALSGNATASEVPLIWLAPDQAEARLRDRVEPEYPADARAAHLSGDVTLEVLVRDDGSVGSVRTLTGNPLLAEAAATAVRGWHYEPYQLKGRPTEFQTDVTLKFSLPE